MAAPGSSFVNCTALSKNLGVRPLVTLTEESPWEVDPGGIPKEAISSLGRSKATWFDCCHESGRSFAGPEQACRGGPVVRALGCPGGENLTCANTSL